MNKGDIATRAQLTARIFITPPAGGAYVNLGDLTGHKRTLTRAGTDVTVAEKGFRRKVRSLTNEVGWEYVFKLPEQFGTVNELALMGTKGSDTTQALVAAPTGTFSFSGVKQGRSYFVGSYQLDTFVVTGKTLGADYTIDLGSGELYIVPGGGIADASNISGTFGCALVVLENYTSIDRAGQQSGACLLQEFDQHDANGVPFRETSGNFQYWIEGGEDQDGKKIAEQELHLLATAKPTVKVRKS
jgi:hypothetical protein